MHHSKNKINIVIIVDIALLNAGKNNRITKNEPQKHTEPQKSFYQYMKKTKTYQTKLITVIVVQEKNFQITIILIDSNHLTQKSSAEDLQTEKTH